MYPSSNEYPLVSAIALRPRLVASVARRRRCFILIRPARTSIEEGRLQVAAMGGTARPTTPGKRSSVAVSHRKATSSVTSNTLNPSLPRMPSLPGLAGQAGTSRMSTSSSISSPSKLRTSPWKSRRQKTSSEDPSTANSTEDEAELEDEIDMSIMSSSASTPYAGVQGRSRSKSTAAAASRASTTTVNNQDSQNICVCIRCEREQDLRAIMRC